MKVEAGDFIELEYYCETKDTREVVENSEGKIIVPIGKGFLPKYLDEEIIGKEIGREYKLEIPPEKAYGIRNENLIKIVPLSSFKRNKINPVPGMIVSIDGKIAIVRSVSGGRVIVDFNHPFAGKTIVAKFKIYRKVKKIDEKIKGILDNLLGKNSYKLLINTGSDKKTLEIKLNEKIRENFKEIVKNVLVENIPEIKDFEIKIEP